MPLVQTLLAAALVAPVSKEPAKPPVPVVTKAYAVVPITTELQRRLVFRGGPDSTALILVNGSAVFKDAATLDADALGPRALRKALTALQPKKDKSVAHTLVHYANNQDTSADGKELLDLALAGAIRASGFVPTTPLGYHSYHNGRFAFDEYVKPLADDTGAAEAEDATGDERAKGYAVRTPLSRLLTGGAGGVIDVRAPLDGRKDVDHAGDVDRSVRAAGAKLKLAKGTRVNFLLNVPERDDKTQDRVRAACRQWAADLGLELESFSY